MFRHILQLTLRNIQRFRNVFIINLFGLSAGMACALLIYLWVSNEWQTDRYHEYDKRLVQVMENHIDAGGIRTSPSTAGLLAETIKKDFAEVEKAAVVAPVKWFDNFTLVDEKSVKHKSRGQFASVDFLSLFSYPVITGETSSALANAQNAVISRELAEQLYGSAENAMGRTLEWQLLHFRKDAIITGVFEQPSSPASSSFDFLLSFEAFKEINPGTLEWGNSGPETFLLLREDTDKKQFNAKIRNYLEDIDPELTYRDLMIRDFSDGYLFGEYNNGHQAGGRIEYVRLFSLVALFILLIGCINFMNLSTAKAAGRIREVGIKKAVGASRKILILQYLTESVLISFLSLVLALGLVSILLPFFNEITGKTLQLSFDLNVISGFILIALFTGILAGSYPAFYLSGFNPALILKGKVNKSVGELWARKGLVIFQFVMSAILIVAVLIVDAQIRFIQNENMGFDRENVIMFPFEGEMSVNPDNFLSRLKRQPGVVNASYLQQTFVENQSFTIGLTWDGKDPDTQVPFQNFTASQGLVETLGLEIVEGRNFYVDPAADTSSLIINETAASVMGMDDPVGATVNLWGNNMQIIGVVKDFQYLTLHEPVKPVFIKLLEGITMNVAVRISGDHLPQTLMGLTEFYENYNPGYSFEYSFLDQQFEQMYAAEMRVGRLSRYFAILAILISCLGLFGLAAFTAERRSKEIGIRKILGSSSTRIIMMLSGEFTRMVLTAVFIAIPVSYFFASAWLDNFTRRIELEWYYFAVAGVAALIISWVAVSFQTWKASRINPVESLRSE